jgi:hypothetical protein
VRRLDRVQNHFPQDRLGRGQGGGLPFSAFRVRSGQNVAFRIIWRSVSELIGVTSWHARAERSVRSSS